MSHGTALARYESQLSITFKKRLKKERESLVSKLAQRCLSRLSYVRKLEEFVARFWDPLGNFTFLKAFTAAGLPLVGLCMFICQEAFK